MRALFHYFRRYFVSIVDNTDVIIHEVGRWQPSDIAFIRQVSFENWHGEDFDLVLQVLIQPRPPQSVGWPDLKGKFWETEICFRGVRDLSYIIRGPWDIQSPGFALEDISARQWDRQRLLVYDYEGLNPDGVRFGAHSAEVRSCVPAKFPPNPKGVWREYRGEYAG